MIKAVIFDMDGVISDTDKTRFLLLKDILKARGLELDDKDYKKSIGVRTHAFLHAMFPKADIDSISRERKEEFRKHPDKYIEPLPYVKECILWLHRSGYKLGIASMALRQDIEMVLQAIKVKELFSFIASSEDISRGKPSPDIYLHAIKGLGFQAEECIAIEDSPIGIEAAKAAGLKCIGVTYTHSRDELKNADVVIDSLEELKKKIRNDQ
jgi:HAD superfamily hydrolase (TIGR01549 family)